MSPRWLGLLGCLAACRHTCEEAKPVAIDAAVETVAVEASAAIEVEAATAPSARSVLEKWNAAHRARDRAAFEAVYAPSVAFYGTTLSRDECVKRKMAALAKTPDFEQVLHGIEVSAIEPNEKLERFLKTTTEKGVSRDYAAYVVLDPDMKIREESDETTDAAVSARLAREASWCLAKEGSGGLFDSTAGLPNDATRPPFTVSARTALEEVRRSKHFTRDLGRVEVTTIVCPTECDATQDDGCGYHMRVESLDKTPGALSNLIEWIYVDAVKNVLKWQLGFEKTSSDVWKSEPLSAVGSPSSRDD